MLYYFLISSAVRTHTNAASIATKILSLVLRSIFSLSNSLSLTFLSHEIQFSTINSAPSTRNIWWVELLRVGRAFLLIAVRKSYLIELENILTAQRTESHQDHKRGHNLSAKCLNFYFGWSVKRINCAKYKNKRKKDQQKNNNWKNKRKKSKVVGEIWRDLEKIITLWRGHHVRIVEILPEKCHGGCERKKFGKFERLKKSSWAARSESAENVWKFRGKFLVTITWKYIRKMWKVAVAEELVSFTSF